MKRYRNLCLGLLGAGMLASTAHADFVINDDLIVDGSACVGFDCVNGETFSFDTLRLKENNLRIKFDDTSVAASFPRNDWQLTANESANGGLSKFSIDDISGSKTPFTIEANAPNHALYVDDGGRVGLGTNTPDVELDIVDGDTPTVRLAQDGSSGFAPQTWDMAGNETNFFIRDVSNGSKLPLRIRPNAPTSSIDIEGTTGDVGFGTASPTSSLHVRRTNASAQVLVEEASGTTAQRDLLLLTNNGGPRMVFTDTSAAAGGAFWRNSVENNANQFVITRSGTGVTEFTLDNSGTLTLIGGLITGTAGSCNLGTPCDAVFQPDKFKVPSISDHADFMWNNSYLKAVGPTKAGEPFNVTQKTTGILHELELAHIYIEQLSRRLIALEKTLAEKE